MRLTEQQQRAITERSSSVILSAGAGCGKTHVLTNRYLSHLENDLVEVSRIVAITFTERAARQMRQRIRSSIVDRLRNAADDSAPHWEQTLKAMETAQITTIHAFCGTLLRQNAVEAGIDSQFEVLEDVLAINLEEDALLSTLQDMLVDETANAQALHDLVILYGWQSVRNTVQHLVQQTDWAKAPQWRLRNVDEIMAEWQQIAREEILPKFLSYFLNTDNDLLHCQSLLQQTPCHGPIMRGQIDEVLTGLASLPTSSNWQQTIDSIIDAARVQGTERTKAWSDAEVYEKIKNALSKLRESLKDLLNRLTLLCPSDEEETVEGIRRSVEIAKKFLFVAEKVQRNYQDLKQQHGVLDFQDLLVQARNLLRDQPLVRQRLQERFQFVLVDELQDTDPVQMELLELLVGSGLRDGKVFAVGDHSQSIYRFRGADVALFQSLKERIPETGRLELTRNFRSQPAILQLVNLLFGALPEGIGQALQDFSALVPHHIQANEEHCIEFLWSPKPANINARQARESEAEWIANRIAGMVKNQEHLVREGTSLRPVQPGDVVMLFRSMANVEIYENALRNHGLHYYLVGGRAFFAQQEIYDIVNLLRALENPQDEVSLVGALRAPFACLSDEALFVLCNHNRQLTLWQALQNGEVQKALPGDQPDRLLRFLKSFQHWRSKKNQWPIAKLLNHILAETGYDAALQFEFLGDRKLANLWKLLDMARRFDRSGLFGLPEFIDRLQDLVKSQPREEQAATQPENANVVRLMSIHQAKGLEFPVVFVPDIGRQVGGRQFSSAVWHDQLGCVVRPPWDEENAFHTMAWQLYHMSESIADWHEELRTFYVACTRAEDYLVLSSAMPDDYKIEGNWLQALAQRFDLATGLPIVVWPEDVPIPKIQVTNSLNAPPKINLPDEKPAIPDEPIDLSLARQACFPQSQGKEIAKLPRLSRDGEDGSNRSEWPIFSQHWPAHSSVPISEAIVRRILFCWSFTDTEAWKKLLEAELRLFSIEQAKRLRVDVSKRVNQLLQSPLYPRLQNAIAVHAQVDCHWQMQPETDLLFAQEPEQRQGIIDCLFQSSSGEWSICFWTFDGKLQSWQTELAQGLVQGQLNLPKIRMDGVFSFDFNSGQLFQWH